MAIALEPAAGAGNMAGMDTQRRMPVLDMTPDGEFRDPAPPPRASKLDRLLGRVGGIALLVALAAGGLVLAGLAVLAVGILLPVVLVAGLIGAGSLWWRLRRMQRQGGAGAVRFTVIRR